MVCSWTKKNYLSLSVGSSQDTVSNVLHWPYCSVLQKQQEELSFMLHLSKQAQRSQEVSRIVLGLGINISWERKHLGRVKGVLVT